MATGWNTTGSLSDSQPVIIDSARLVREYPNNVYQSTCEVNTLEPNTGLKWDEISLSQLSAQAITETTTLNNPQQMADTLFSIEPTVSGIHLIFTDKVYRRLSKQVVAKLGQGGQNAIERKKDEDYLATFAGATTTLSGTGTTLASGVVNAAHSRITGNVTEPATGKISTVLHAFQLKDIRDEVTSGVGTYAIPEGLTAEAFRKGFSGTLDGTEVYVDGNITIDATPDARGAVHAKEAIVLVQGHSLRSEKKRSPEKGGGADELFIYDDYALGERSAGNWLYGILSDATSPTG